MSFPFVRLALAAGGLFAGGFGAAAQSLQVRVPNLATVDGPVSVDLGGATFVNQGLQGVGRISASTRGSIPSPARSCRSPSRRATS
ncbi:hypothetical protein [Methylobacterium sp. JK268]